MPYQRIEEETTVVKPGAQPSNGKKKDDDERRITATLSPTWFALASTFAASETAPHTRPPPSPTFDFCCWSNIIFSTVCRTSGARSPSWEFSGSIFLRSMYCARIECQRHLRATCSRGHVETLCWATASSWMVWMTCRLSRNRLHVIGSTNRP